MEITAIVTVLVLLQYVWFGIQVASVRGKHGLQAPAMSGHPEYDRMFRVHYNTMEQLVLFLPALWLYGYMVSHLWAAGFGAVFLIGRFVYRAEYLKDPASRTLGFAMTFLPSATMLIWVLVVAVKAVL